MIYAIADNFENMLNKISEKQNKEKIENFSSTISITIENKNNKTKTKSYYKLFDSLIGYLYYLNYYPLPLFGI